MITPLLLVEKMASASDLNNLSNNVALMSVMWTSQSGRKGRCIVLNKIMETDVEAMHLEMKSFICNLVQTEFFKNLHNLIISLLLTNHSEFLAKRNKSGVIAEGDPICCISNLATQDLHVIHTQ